jgi:hypothetical protein
VTFLGDCLFDDCVELVHLINDSDASTLVGVFSGLDDPYVSHFSFGVDWPLFLFFLFLFLDNFVSLFVELAKPNILWILDSIFDMEGEWKIVKGILFDQCVIFLKIVKQCFLIT